MQKEYEIKVRGRLGPDEKDVQEIDLLGRTIKYEAWCLYWQADPRHRKMIILEHFGLDESSKVLSKTGDKEDDKAETEEVNMSAEEATVFRGVAARANYMSADCPQVQYAKRGLPRHGRTHGPSA